MPASSDANSSSSSTCLNAATVRCRSRYSSMSRLTNFAGDVRLRGPVKLREPLGDARRRIWSNASTSSWRTDRGDLHRHVVDVGSFEQGDDVGDAAAGFVLAEDRLAQQVRGSVCLLGRRDGRRGRRSAGSSAGNSTVAGLASRPAGDHRHHERGATADASAPPRSRARSSGPRNGRKPCRPRGRRNRAAARAGSSMRSTSSARSRVKRRLASSASIRARRRRCRRWRRVSM